MVALAAGVATVWASIVPLLLPSPAIAVGLPCAWQIPVNADTLNIALPDEGANYWMTIMPMPSGGKVEIAGKYPHARYLSFTAYGANLAAVDSLADVDIAPDPGSTNPFVAGARRDLADRTYTIEVTSKAPAGDGSRAPNTVYNSPVDGSRSTAVPGLLLLLIRVYRPDEGHDRTGGVGLPRLTSVSATGTRATVRNCPDAADRPASTSRGAGPHTTIPLPDQSLFGSNPPVWRKYSNLASQLISSILSGNLLRTAVADRLTAVLDRVLPSGGFIENPDNAYVSSAAVWTHGKVLELRGRLPTFADTHDGVTTMPENVQLRYWSMCTNTVLTTVTDCVIDDQVVSGPGRTYRIVVSKAADRPANAVTGCGVTWLEAGPTPVSALIMRNMLPDPTFAQAVQKSTVGTEESVLDAFYPRGTYYRTAQDYEAMGCTPAIGETP